MERQYIGARYVPKFFENPNTGDSTWLTGVAYEPLTIVTYAGNSYTSKKPVPAGIGAPNANPTYWVSTGNFNEQLEELKEQVNGILPITPEKMADKKYVIITDSYGSYTDALNRNFITLACSYAGIDPANVYTASRGSAGFFRPSDLNFLDVFRSLESDIADPDEITDVFVFGGANDQVASDSASINTGISNFCSYVKSHYANATIYIGFVTKSWAGNLYPNYPRTLKCYTECGQYGANYLTGSECIMSLNTLFRNDHVHPTTEAVTHIAKYVSNLLTAHTCQVEYEAIYGGILSIDNQTISASVFQDNTILTYKNGASVLGCGNGGIGLTIDCKTSFPAQNTSITGLKLLKCFNPPLTAYSNATPCIVICTTNGVFKTVDGFISFTRDPNEDNSYTGLLIIYANEAIPNVTRIAIGFNESMNG